MGNRDNDYVSYKATDKNGVGSNVNHICYSNHMEKLTDYSFDLLPYRTSADWKKWAIDGESYLRVVDLFKDNLLIHPKVKAKVDGDGLMRMHIPIGMSSHRVYSAMCAFRWAESMSPFVYLIIKLSEERKNLSFWQILHYVMSTQVGSVGHNWCNVCQTQLNYGYIYSNNGMGYNLGLSLSFPLFWHKTEEELLKYPRRTCKCIDEISTKIAPCKPKEGVKYGLTVPTLLVCGSLDGKPAANDVLNPIWTPLYKYAGSMAVCDYDEAAVQKELLGMYEEITKDYEPTKKLREQF
jgi:hypothetical protein